MFNRTRIARAIVASLVIITVSAITFASPWTSGLSFLGLAKSESSQEVVRSARAIYLAAGTCDTAGPIEVESTLGTLAGTPTAYASLAAAFTAINGGVTNLGAVTIDVCGDTNEAAATVFANQVAGITSITMSPAGGAARTITGAPAGGNSLILMNGVDNFTIDGLNSGGNSLTISNTTVSNTSNTSTIRFVDGATNNVITNSNIQGSATMGGTTNGGTIFFSTDGATSNGNDNNTISNNNIGPAGSNIPSRAIYGNGSQTTTAIGNSGILINNNNIYDYFLGGASSAGVGTNTGNNNWSITNNRFYQTAPRPTIESTNGKGTASSRTCARAGRASMISTTSSARSAASAISHAGRVRGRWLRRRPRFRLADV